MLFQGSNPGYKKCLFHYTIIGPVRIIFYIIKIDIKIKSELLEIYKCSFIIIAIENILSISLVKGTYQNIWKKQVLMDFGKKKKKETETLSTVDGNEIFLPL